MNETVLPRLILFDFGGVLLRLNDPVKTFGFGSSRADFNERWLAAGAVQAHERGEIGPEEFGRRMVGEMGLPYSPDEFIRRFDGWPDRVTPETAAVVGRIPASIDCAILSNTNGLHWAAQDVARDFGGRISRCFLSFEIGAVKPDAAIFDYVRRELPCAPSEVLFIDDNPKNLDAGRRAGLRCRHCPDVDELESVLQGAGVLD